jgi:hypothetical protein
VTVCFFFPDRAGRAARFCKYLAARFFHMECEQMPPVIPALIAAGVAIAEGATFVAVLEATGTALLISGAQILLAPHPKSSAGAGTAGSVAQPLKLNFAPGVAVT